MSDDAREQLDRDAGLNAQSQRRLARAIGWVRAHKLLAMAGLVSAGVAMLLVGIMTLGRGSTDGGATVAAAVAALDAGDFSRAATLAEAARRSEQTATEDWAALYFVLGELAFRDAESDFETHKKPLYAIAASHFEQSRDRGFPLGRAARGYLLLGQCLYQVGRTAEARDALAESLRAGVAEPWQVHRLLAEAYLNDSQPDYQAALTHNAELLADTSRDPDQQHAAKLQRAQILFHLGDTAATAQLLAEIPDDSSLRGEILLVKGLLLLDEARRMSEGAVRSDEHADGPVDAARIREEYREAVDVLSRAQAEDSLRSRITRKAAYLVAVCYYETGQYRAALDRFTRVGDIYVDTPEALSSKLYEAEILQQFDQPDLAVTSFRQVLRMADAPDRYRNEWIPLDELRRRIQAAFEFWLAAGKYQAAVELARSLYPLFSRDLAARWEADAERQWGQALLNAAESLPYGESVSARNEGLEHLRLAGRGYLRSARLRYTSREYPEDVWTAAQNYLAGQGYGQATIILREYLSNEARVHRSEALVDLGEALLASGHRDEAVGYLQECIDVFPQEAPVYRARLLLSRAA
ncbi:MAG: tetratricopeptide repeat protein, partial [Planctomycetales bacterium]|nr:tetratricopeptide repeat protein [Planctomycetales bacterium]